MYPSQYRGRVLHDRYHGRCASLCPSRRSGHCRRCFVFNHFVRWMEGQMNEAPLADLARIGGSCGGAIGASIWTEKLPAALQAIPGINATMAAGMYGDLRVARAAEPRQQVIQAYLDTAWYLELPALLIGLLPIIFGLLTTNFYLGDTQNAIETDKKVVMQDASETTDERIREKVRAAEEQAKAQVAGKAAAAA